MKLPLLSHVEIDTKPIIFCWNRQYVTEIMLVRDINVRTVINRLNCRGHCVLNVCPGRGHKTAGEEVTFRIQRFQVRISTKMSTNFTVVFVDFGGILPKFKIAAPSTSIQILYSPIISSLDIM